MQIAERFQHVRALDAQHAQFRLLRSRQGARPLVGGDQERTLGAESPQSPRKPRKTNGDGPGDQELSTGKDRTQQVFVVGTCLFGQR